MCLPIDGAINLAERPADTSPVYGFSEREISFSELLPGNVVRLRDESVVLVVKVVEANSCEYIGEIVEFENHEEPEYKGLTPGKPIPFKYKNVFDVERMAADAA